MLAKRIIPCLDVTAGRVVKGVNFVNLRDAGDPVELADRYNEQGADELVFLDITASSDARDIMADVVARTARDVFIPLTVGGGIRSVADARKILHVRRRQGQRQHRGRPPSGTDHANSARNSAPKPSCWPSTQSGAGRAGGTSIRAAAATMKASMRSNGPQGRSAGRRRDPAHVDGHRRRPDRLRLRTDSRRFPTLRTFP